jgi:protein rIIB|nr:MAG TPA: Redirecting phage packaging protein C packaging protein, DNA Binding.0A [Caudoviricetes sp.]
MQTFPSSMTQKKIAEALGISERTVRRYIASGQIKIVDTPAREAAKKEAPKKAKTDATSKPKKEAKKELKKAKAPSKKKEAKKPEAPKQEAKKDFEPKHYPHGTRKTAIARELGVTPKVIDGRIRRGEIIIDEADESQTKAKTESKKAEAVEAIEPGASRYDVLITAKAATIYRHQEGHIASMRTFPADDYRYSRIKEMHQNGDQDYSEFFAELKLKEVSFVTEHGVKVSKEGIYLNNLHLQDQLADWIVENIDSISPDSSYIRFLDNLAQNPDQRMQEQLYGFLKHTDVKINEDGMVLAYKAISHNFKDIHSNTFDNSVGAVVEMPRDEVDDDPENTCSHGLHVAAASYIPQYGRKEYQHRVVQVLINPKDFVSIPVDYNFAKARVCRYNVAREVTWEEIWRR